MVVLNMLRVLLWGVVLGISVPAYAEHATKDILVAEVGLSKNTNRVFVKSSTLASNSECVDKELYAMELGSAESYLFYSAALTSMNEGKRMRVLYMLDQCVGNTSEVRVFWNLKD